LVAAAKFLVAATKILFVVSNFVAVTKHFFRAHVHVSGRILALLTWDSSHFGAAVIQQKLIALERDSMGKSRHERIKSWRPRLFCRSENTEFVIKL